MHRRRIPDEHITPAIAELKAAKFDRFSANFIHCTTGNATGPVNWFDDQWWEIISHNMGMMARVARRASGAECVNSSG